MLRSIVLQSPSTILLDPAASDLSRSRSLRSGVVCNAQRSSSSIPKLQPFSRSKIDRWIPEPSFLQKCENELTEYCTTLEGDESCSCWRAYFELKDLEKEMPKEDVEKFVRQIGGRKSLIQCLHGLSAIEKKSKNMRKSAPLDTEEVRTPFPVPDGLPKTKEEIEEEEGAKMPDSPFTKLLRSMGRHPAWFSETPDHETD